jgi:hypothetical protein
VAGEQIQPPTSTSVGELGPELAVYRARAFGARELFTLFIPGVLLVFVPLGYGIYRAYTAYTRFGPAVAERWSRPWYLLALAALVVFLLLILLRLRLARRRVAVHQGGLNLVLARRRILPWISITGISTAITRRTFLGWSLGLRYSAVIYPARGRPVHLAPYLEALPELISRIKASLYPRLATGLKNELKAGRWVRFGPLSIHPAALQVNKRRVPWAEIQGLTIQDGDLLVEWVNQPRARLPISQIPNLELFLELAQECAHANLSGPAPQSSPSGARLGQST